MAGVDDQGVCVRSLWRQPAIGQEAASVITSSLHFILETPMFINRCSGIEPQSAGQYMVPPIPVSFLESADHPFCRMSRSWS
jgi:hypothetical protein